MSNAIITVISETDLRNGHLGLMLEAKKRRVDVRLLQPGEFAMFLNRAQTAFKLYAANSIIVHYKHRRGRVSLEAVKYIPEIFNAGEFSYDKALEKVLTRRLKN